MNFLDRFSKNTQISNFLKIRQVGAKLLHADGHTDKTDGEANRCFSQFYELAQQRAVYIIRNNNFAWCICIDTKHNKTSIEIF